MTRECCGSRQRGVDEGGQPLHDWPQPALPTRVQTDNFPKENMWETKSRPVNGVKYQKVCGRITAYQDHSTNAFQAYYNDRQRTIDSVYVDGVSITHGYNPRKHIWTFAAAWDETRGRRVMICPSTRTDRTYTGWVPPFIGQDYFLWDWESKHQSRQILYRRSTLEWQWVWATLHMLQLQQPSLVL